MEAGFEFKTESSTDCGCCHLSPDTSDGLYGCKDRSTILTLREQEVLDRIRATGERAREIKRNLRQATGEGRSDWASMGGELEELENLREMRMNLEDERLAAADERMRFLGHL